MKHLKTIFYALRGLFVVLATAISLPLSAADIRLEDMDSVEISLLTCQPHDEVYSLYGHTALRYHELWKDGIDAAFNYGVFDYNKPHFVLRFVFGLTDYELGVFPYGLFELEYRHFGSMVVEQVLNLTPQEKYQLRQALMENLKPENRVYRYNYFYNNCTTKARDIIEQNVNGTVEYAGREDYTPSYRELVHQMTKQNPWSQFGNDFLLGVKSDQPTTRRQQEFLPLNLLYDFDHATIVCQDSVRPLVKERRIAVPAGVQVIQSGFPLTPRQCFGILLLIACVLFLWEWRKQRAFVVWDVLLMLLTGVMGVVLFLMLFSQHPTVSLNLQILLINPLPLLFLWPVVRRRPTRYWLVTALLALLFLLGSLVQHYAEGIIVLALCLLLQCCIHLKFKVVK